MLSSPRSPDSTMRIFSSAVNCRRLARRISFTTCSAGFLTGPDFCPIFAPSMATMGQKSSLLQLSQSVSWALMPDRLSIEVEGGDLIVEADRDPPAGLLAELRQHKAELIAVLVPPVPDSPRR